MEIKNFELYRLMLLVCKLANKTKWNESVEVIERIAIYLTLVKSGMASSVGSLSWKNGNPLLSLECDWFNNGLAVFPFGMANLICSWDQPNCFSFHASCPLGCGLIFENSQKIVCFLSQEVAQATWRYISLL